MATIPSTAAEFLGLVQKSGLVSMPSLTAHLEQLRSQGDLPSSPRDLAQVLIRDGFLTRFQSNQLLAGKHHGFILAGKYKLLEHLGAGGMATVFLCEHVVMKRLVALKVLPPDQAGSPSALERFQREARAAAQLDHPNIVRAHDIDRDGKHYFLVMEYVDGSNLYQIVKQHGPLEVERACHYIAQAASGLQHAHEVGLVHRDIKPNNLLLDRSGTVKILDMGLARFFHDASDNLTREHDSGSVLGTADYMAPEQALNSHEADIRSDIYSLGVTFYFLLAGESPYGKGSMAQKLIWHQVAEPRSLVQLRPEIPEELAAIISRMMAKKPEDRYATPAEVFEALGPWLQNPIAPPSEAEMPQRSRFITALSPNENGPNTRSQRTLRLPQGPGSNQGSSTPRPAGPKSNRAAPKGDTPEPRSANPRRQILVAIIALVLLTGAVTGGWLAWSHVIQGRGREVPPVARNPTPDPIPPEVLPPPPINPVLPTAGEEERMFIGHTAAVETVLFSPDGKQLLSAGRDKTIRLWDVATGHEVRRFEGHTDVVRGLALLPAPAGRVPGLLSGSWDRTIRLWNLQTGEEVRRFEGHEQHVQNVAACVDGRRFVSSGNDQTLRVWDVDTARELNCLRGHTKQVCALAVTPDGRRAVSGGHDRTVRLWDLETGDELRRLDVPAAVFRVDVSPDGNWAVFGTGTALQLWHLGTGEQRSLTTTPAEVTSAAFTVNARYILASHERTVQLWEVGSGQGLEPFRGHGDVVWDVAVSQDGLFAASCGLDRSVRLWRLPAVASGPFVGELRRLAGHENHVEFAIPSPDGRRILSTGLDKTVRLWDAVTGKELRKLGPFPGACRGVAYFPDSRRAVFTAGDKIVRLWDVEKGDELQRFEGHKGNLSYVTCSPDGKRILSTSVDKTLKLWDVETGAELKELKGHTNTVTSAVFSHDGKEAFSGSQDKTVRRWDLESGQELSRLDQAFVIWRLCLSHDGKWLTFGNEASVRLWNWSTGEVRTFTGEGMKYISDAEFTPDDRHILSAGHDGTVRVWEVETEKEVYRFEKHDNQCLGALPTLDGRRVISCGRDKLIRIWQLPPELASKK